MPEDVVKMDEPKAVELEVPALEEKPKRGRPKKTEKAEKKEEHLELEQNIAVMIKTVFDMMAVRDPIWKLADTEVEAVAKPGARILARLGAEEDANKNADYLLLIVGIAGIILPRVMVIRARGGQVKQSNEQPERTVNSGGGKPAAAGSRNVASNVKQLLPALG